MRYNPVEHGNDISIRDKLVSLAETESVFYSGAAKALLQVTIQLLDEFKGAKVTLSGDTRTTETVERSLPFVQRFYFREMFYTYLRMRFLQTIPNYLRLK